MKYKRSFSDKPNSTNFPAKHAYSLPVKTFTTEVHNYKRMVTLLSTNQLYKHTIKYKQFQGFNQVALVLIMSNVFLGRMSAFP